MRVGVIGTAGRNCLDRLNADVYDKMALDFENILRNIREVENKSIELVSGGAAWVDHLAVRIYLEDIVSVESIHLYLPCKFYLLNSCFDCYSQEGKTLNFYHGKFSSIIIEEDLDFFYSRKQLSMVIDNESNYTVISGFKNRNIEVGKVDLLVAYTFGKNVPLSGSGTWHCWKNSIAKKKIHRCISLL
jgi:hypothetical protein